MSTGTVFKMAPQREPRREGRRRFMRVALHRGGTVRQGAGAVEHVAFVRDFNFNGVYLFSNFAPRLGTTLDIEFSLPDSSTSKRVMAHGRVVRVDAMDSGVVGIAAEFQDCELSADAAS